jgi:glycosyltransferase involved in cell wall biosynthesis
MHGETTNNWPQLGIVVATYSRLQWLRMCVENIIKLTVTPFQLVVADDGSDDDTVDWCHSQGIRVVTGPNRGVAHNKNRGLLALEALGCDPIFIFEDDLMPVAPGWESEWLTATALWHHVAFAREGIARTAVAGEGTAADPWVSPRTTAQLLTISTTALQVVGYFDPRFEGWGHEHAEWTSRIKQAGYGYKKIALAPGKSYRAQLFLNSGLTCNQSPSWRDDAQAERNRNIMVSTSGEPLFRVPWRTYEERTTILEEVRASGVDADNLAVRLDERAQQSTALPPSAGR